MKTVPRHAKDRERGTIHLSDFKPSNLHPKAKFRIGMAILGTLLLIFSCCYMLSTASIYFNIDLSTSVGINYLFKDLVAIGYVVGTILVIIILWYLMIKDCPISPAAKANYNVSHDKSMKSVKLITAIAGAVATKGSAASIDNVATAMDNYLTEEVPQDINPKIKDRR